MLSNEFCHVQLINVTDNEINCVYMVDAKQRISKDRVRLGPNYCKLDVVTIVDARIISPVVP